MNLEWGLEQGPPNCEQRTLRTANTVKSSICANGANIEQCAQRTVRTVHIVRTVRTANGVNGSYCPNSANSEQSEQFIFSNCQAERTGANTVRWSLALRMIFSVIYNLYVYIK